MTNDPQVLDGTIRIGNSQAGDYAYHIPTLAQFVAMEQRETEARWLADLAEIGRGVLFFVFVVALAYGSMFAVASGWFTS